MDDNDLAESAVHAEIMKALGDPTRLKIILYLANAGSLCVNALAYRLNAKQPTISQHFKVLKNAGLVTTRREANHIHYELNRECLGGTAGFCARILQENKDGGQFVPKPMSRS